MVIFVMSVQVYVCAAKIDPMGFNDSFVMSFYILYVQQISATQIHIA